MMDDLMSVDMNDALRKIFGLQFNLQTKILGRIMSDMTLTERIEYIKENVLAATDELHELLNETSWKSWASGDPYINRDAAVKEGVDVLHFLVNLFLALDVSPEELLTRYAGKNKVNHNRQDNGYDAVSTKCASCGRALEDITIRETLTADYQVIYRCVCNEELPAELVKPFITD
jgi:dimeric dUTPase (all-alpha-NTP-PPase superfamily)